MDRLDAISAHTGKDGKTYYNRLGVAFAAKDGTGWNLKLRSMPAPEDGEFTILLREPRDRDQQHRANLNRNPRQDDDSDSIPF